jgi:hypothetical protein
MRILAVLTAALAIVPAASGYDRTPIRIAGLTPDKWGQSTTKAETLLIARYHGIRSVECFPVIMIGYPESTSSFTNGGLTRFWDKLACAGATVTGKQFALIFDAKGRQAWIIYRLKGVTVNALIYG